MTATTTTAPKATRHRLHNVHGWVLTYHVCGDRVRVARVYRGERAGPLEMSRAEARVHYRAMRAAGFTTTAGGL